MFAEAASPKCRWSNYVNAANFATTILQRAIIKQASRSRALLAARRSRG
jgi:hypothetical protein